MFSLKGEPNDSLKAPFLFPWGDKWTVSCAVINPMIRGPKRGQLRLMHTPLPHVTHRSSGMTHETVARGPACPAVTPLPAKTAVHRHCWLTASVFYASSRSPSRIWCAIRFLGCNLWECLFIYFYFVYFLPELLVCSVKENCIEMTLLFLQRARPFALWLYLRRWPQLLKSQQKKGNTSSYTENSRRHTYVNFIYFRQVENCVCFANASPQHWLKRTLGLLWLMK